MFKGNTRARDFLVTGIIALVVITAFLLEYCTPATAKAAPSPYAKQVTQEQIQEVVHFTLSALHKQLEIGWKIRIVPNWIVLPSADGQLIFADGFTDMENKVVYVYHHQPCLAASSLIHELMHAVGYSHEDKMAFIIAKDIQENAVKTLCPEGYKPRRLPPPTPEEIQETIRQIQELGR